MTDIYKPILEIIRNGNYFLVASHAHPDGDGIGSTIALGKAIENMGKKVVMFNANKVPFNLAFLPHSSEVVNRIVPDASFDATFFVDCAQQNRIGGDVENMKRERLGKVVLIDHHEVLDPHCDICCIDAGAAATGEVVYRFFKYAGVKITNDVANLLLCTFVVDTGSFKYSNTSGKLLRAAAELLDEGASTWIITKEMDESNPPEYIKLLGLVMATFEMSPTKDAAWIVLTRQMLFEANASVEVSEEFINFPRSIAGVEVAMLFREQESLKWKVSFRSKDRVDVQKIALKFNGGGHKHAAGCTLGGDLASVKATIIGEVEKQLA